MGMIGEWLGHILPICGNGMGRLDDNMELIWAMILSNFKLWKMHEKQKSWCYLFYGRALGKKCP